MIQKLLLYGYVLLGMAAFWFWLSALVDYARMVRARAAGHSLLAAALSGIFTPSLLNRDGIRQRQKLLNNAFRCLAALTGMVLIVFLGVLTQG
jgi:hypothetical protein